MGGSISHLKPPEIVNIRLGYFVLVQLHWLAAGSERGVHGAPHPVRGGLPRGHLHRQPKGKRYSHRKKD